MTSKPHAIGDTTQTVTLEESLNFKKKASTKAVAY